MEIRDTYVFLIIRDANMEIEEYETYDLITA